MLILPIINIHASPSQNYPVAPLERSGDGRGCEGWGMLRVCYDLEGDRNNKGEREKDRKEEEEGGGKR